MAHRDIPTSDPLVTANAFAPVGGSFDGREAHSVTVVVDNTGAAGADVELQGALDDAGPWFAIDVGSVAAGTQGTLTIALGDYWTRYRVVAKSTIAATPTDVTMTAAVFSSE